MIEQGVEFGHADTPGGTARSTRRKTSTSRRTVLAADEASAAAFPGLGRRLACRARCYVRELHREAGWDATDERAMDAAVRYAVSMQEFAGLDVVTDGEWRRRSYIGVIAELAHGFTLGREPRRRPAVDGGDREARRRSSPGFIAREATFLRRVAHVGTKITLPAPALLGERLWDPERSTKAYPKREDFVRDCVEPLRREIELIARHRRRHRADRRSASVPVRRSRRAHAATTIPTAPPISRST